MIYIPLVILVMVAMTSFADAMQSKGKRSFEHLQYSGFAIALAVVYSLYIFTNPWIE